MTGFVAIETVAKLAMVSGRGQRLACGDGLRTLGVCKAGQGASRAAAAEMFQGCLKPAARSPVPLQKQEQIKGPENGSIARFDGLGCYQSGSETAMVSGRGQRLGIAGNALAGFGRVKDMAQAGLRQCRFWAARLQPELQFAIRNLHPQPESRIPQFAAQSLVSLQKQGQIKGPENGSIARFQGLCRYRNGSETGDGLRRVGGGWVCGRLACARRGRASRAAAAGMFQGCLKPEIRSP